jgi:hypothetical protein
LPPGCPACAGRSRQHLLDERVGLIAWSIVDCLASVWVGAADDA